MRIVTISDSIAAPTGFGTQHALMASALARAGLGDVLSLGLWEAAPLERHAGGFWTLGLGRNGVADLAARWPELQSIFQPEVVVTLGDLHMFDALTARGQHWGKAGSWRWAHWYPVDSPTYQADRHGQLELCDHLVLMSGFGYDVVQPYLRRKELVVIPHGVDTELFRPATAEERAVLRDEMSEHWQTDLRRRRLLVSTETNQWRKDTYVLVRMLADLPPDVALLLHCSPQPRDGSAGWDLGRFARMCGVADRVFFTGSGSTRSQLPRRQVADLVRAADLRVSATEGEGFGIGTIEASACGVPSVITDCTTSRELLNGHEVCLARVAHWHVQPASLLARAKVDEADLTSKVWTLLDSAATRESLGEKLRAFTVEHFSLPCIERAWADHMSRIAGATDHAYRPSSLPAGLPCGAQRPPAGAEPREPRHADARRDGPDALPAAAGSDQPDGRA